MAATRPVSARTATSAPIHVVASAFVTQYYNILRTSPDDVYRFYISNNRVSRPSGATTLEAIKRKIEAMGKVVHVDVEALESKESESHTGGITVLSRGRISFLGGQPRAFSQSFLLAPQDTGYFVLEDTLTYPDNAGA